MTHLNSNLSDVINEQPSGLYVGGRASSEEACASKPADTVYRIAAMVGALLLLFTVAWAG
jgi:hypothetical protein